ncbi:MAG TPA: hypothetical protein VKP12_18100 [Kiloniellaceae bacterium]|nr:hypothetical protein [Kiloniellaceae bacterium]
MRQIVKLALAAALVVGAAQGAAASPPAAQSALQAAAPKFLSQKDVEASGGYRLAVPGRGEFKVVRVGSSKDPAKKCLVETASLKRLIAAAPRGGSPTAGIIIELRAYTGGSCPSDSICCSGSGNGCSVEVVIVQKPSGGGGN